MELQRYRAAQDLESRRILQLVLQVLSRLIGRQVTEDQWLVVVRALFPTVVQSRQRSFELARLVIETQNPAAPTVAPPPYSEAFLFKALERTVFGRLGDPQRAQQAVADGAAAVVRHVEQAGREGMIRLVEADREALGWARVARGGTTCAFCLLLVSRGPVYRAMDNAVFRAHDKCDCIAVPVYDRNNWFGRAQYLEADRLYREATAGVVSGGQINAFRRAVEAPGGSELPAAA